jgi:hypothetical protein
MTLEASPARQLRIAFAMIEQHAPEGADKVDILRRLGLMLARLKREAVQHRVMVTIASEDLHRVCRRCGGEFLIEADEVTFFAMKHFELPRHCPPCRAQRRAEKVAAGQASMLPEGDVA